MNPDLLFLYNIRSQIPPENVIDLMSINAQIKKTAKEAVIEAAQAVTKAVTTAPEGAPSDIGGFWMTRDAEVAIEELVKRVIELREVENEHR